MKIKMSTITDASLTAKYCDCALKLKTQQQNSKKTKIFRTINGKNLGGPWSSSGVIKWKITRIYPDKANSALKMGFNFLFQSKFFGKETQKPNTTEENMGMSKNRYEK